MPHFIVKIFCASAVLFCSLSLSAQVPQVITISKQIPSASVASALQASPYSFDFENIEIDRVAQLIESIQPMDIVFAPNINPTLTSLILIKESSLLDILQTALKPHNLQIKILAQDLFWIESITEAKNSISFARHQQPLPLMPIELCEKKTNFILKELKATHIQFEYNDMLEDLGKNDRIRAQLNNQQVQIYCMRHLDDVSAKIIVVGQQKNSVEHTIKQLIQAYQE